MALTIKEERKDRQKERKVDLGFREITPRFKLDPIPKQK